MMHSCGMFCCTPLNKTGISGVQEWNAAGTEQEAGALAPQPASDLMGHLWKEKNRQPGSRPESHALNLPLAHVYLSWAFFV